MHAFSNYLYTYCSILTLHPSSHPRLARWNRGRRLFRAAELNFKAKELPLEIQETIDPDQSYVWDHLMEVEKEEAEWKEINHYV